MSPSPEEIRLAQRIAAKVALRDPRLMPIFERMESEVAKLDARDATLERARQAAKG